MVAHGPLLWAKAMSSHKLLPQDLSTSGAEQYSLEEADIRFWSSKWLHGYARRKMKFEISMKAQPSDGKVGVKGLATQIEHLLAGENGLGSTEGAAAGSWRPFLTVPNPMLPPSAENAADAFAAYGSSEEQLLAPSSTRPPLAATRVRGPRVASIQAIAFFGRIEVRKGIVALCDALDMVAAAAEVGRLPSLSNRTAASLASGAPDGPSRMAGKNILI